MQTLFIKSFGIQRFLKYANANNWVLGRGPLEYTFLPTVKPIADAIYKKLWNSKDRASYDEIEVLRKISGYRGKVIATWIDLFGRVRGKITDAELLLLDFIRKKDPTNPIYAALKWKYTGKQQYFDIASGYLDDESVFPSDRLPGHLEHIDWGDDAGFVIYAWICNILYGSQAP